MQLNTFTDYCLRVLIYLATAPEGRATIAEIAQAYGVSENHLVKVAHRLGQAGILRNTRGRGGGLSLAKPAADINVGQVVRLAEGRAGPAECFQDASTCVIAPACRLAGVLGEAMNAFYRVLDAATLADLVRRRPQLVSILHRAPRPHAYTV
jgi:Rrf2 family nitric oxide-sensitive transcriptional repressor